MENTIKTEAEAEASRAAESLLITVDDVKKETKLGKSTVHKLIASGDLPAVRIGRSVRVRRSDLMRWIDERATA